jgi:putative PEP-CTERM system histidine kinase
LPVVVDETLYSICALAYFLVIALMVLRGRTSRTGVAIILCCLLSAAWAGASAFRAALPFGGAVSLLDSVRVSGWLLFTVALLPLRAWRRGRHYLAGAAALCASAIACDAYLLWLGPDASDRVPVEHLLRIGLGVAGLLAVENLWRNTEAERKRRAWPICLAIGGLFAFDIFLFADAFMTRSRVDPDLALGQPIVAIFMSPLLAMAMARNREWRVDIHVSREVVLHTATLVASGCFLLAIALVGMLLRGFGGVWGRPLELTMLIGSGFVLAFVLGTGGFRKRLKLLISRHFFSNRYDYRVAWLKFIDLVSGPQNVDKLQVRIIRALAEFVDSPAGVLWSLTPGVGYHPTATWKLSLPQQPKLAAGDGFILGFRGGAWILVRGGDGAPAPGPLAAAAAWLAVPLLHGGDIVGFVVLDRPAHPVTLDREAFDLLRAAGRQAASYLAEERSTRALLDAERLNDYTKRFAFVVHDIKNLASQLGLILTNARRHIDDPEFQRDMLQTVEDSVARMNRLLSQLKADATPQPSSPVDPDAIIAGVAAGFAGRSVIVESRLGPEDCAVAIGAERLKAALTHLVQNAIDASPASQPVTIRSHRLGDELVIEVVDLGVGMDADFVRDELFRPFRSTKSDGYGIGAFQTRDLIRTSGGDLEVVSKKGAGTTMRVVLPLAAGKEAATRTAAA